MARKVYHVTTLERVGQILAEGLRPFSQSPAQRGGVTWFWEREESARGWRELHPEKEAILEVDDDAGDIKRGRTVPRGVAYTTRPIPPSRIRRVRR